MKKPKQEKISFHGWLNIDKPVGVTSTQITNLVKRTLNPKKIGHAGTLDPAASGILPLALGEATKVIELIQDAKKEYIFTIRFGETTDSLDADGNITETGGRLPALNEIENIIPKFIGKIKQFPPAFSAVKIDGKRAYDLARAGIEVKTKEREIEIYSLNLHPDFETKYEDGLIKEITLICECSKGTYIRTLGADIATSLQTIGYIVLLRRISVGWFNLFNSLKIEGTEGLLLDKNQLIDLLKPIDAVLDDIPVLHLTSDECKKLKDGKVIPTNIKTEGIHRVYLDKKLFALVTSEKLRVKLWKFLNLENLSQS